MKAVHHLKSVLSGCHSAYNRKRELTRKLLKHPFFPILFIGEAIKTAVVHFVAAGAFLNATVFGMAIAAVVATLLWIYAEVIMESVEEVTDN